VCFVFSLCTNIFIILLIKALSFIDLPREGMTDDEALKKSDEKSVIRRAKKLGYANNNSDFAQIGSSSKVNYNVNQKSNFSFNQPTLTNAVNYNFTPSNNKPIFNFDTMSGRFYFI
jgi:hypothetical protein